MNLEVGSRALQVPNRENYLANSSSRNILSNMTDTVPVVSFKQRLR